MTPPPIPGWICEEAIGHGADATVWRARPVAGGVPVALKVTPLARLRDPTAHLREAWAAGSTGSRHVVAVLDAGQDGEHAWLAMELASEDAAMLAARCGGRLPTIVASRIARDVGRGLQTLADHGFVHRDVKPSNILLRADGTAMIGDLAPMRGGGTATRSAEISGTPAYLTPEQIRGSAPDMRSDVHALGATLFTLIAGRTPFAADGALDLLRAIAETPAPDLRTLVPDVPPPIASVVATALAKDALMRQQRPGQFAADIDEALAGRTPSRAVAPAVRHIKPSTQPYHWPAWLPFATAGFAALLGLGIGLVAGRPTATALAAEVVAVEAAAAARRDRSTVQAESVLLVGLQARIDQLHHERDRLMKRSTQIANKAEGPSMDTENAETPIPAKPQRPEVAPRPSTAPDAGTTRPVVTAVQSAVPIPAPARLPMAKAAPAFEIEPAASLPRIHTIKVEKADALAGFSVNPQAVNHIVAWTSNKRLWWSGDHGTTWSYAESTYSELGRTSGGARLGQWQGSNGFVPGTGQRAGWLTRDGGQTWIDVPPPKPVIALSTVEWPGQRAMTADGTIHAAAQVSGQSRAWRICSTRDAGVNWIDLVDVQADKLALNACRDRLVIAAGSGTWQSSIDLGKTWQDLATGSHEMSVWSRDTASLQLLSWRGGLSVLDLESGRWSVVALAQPEGANMVSFALDPRDPTCAFAIDPRTGLIRTTDQGRTWRPCALALFGSPQSILIVGRVRPRLYCCSANRIISIDLTLSCDDIFPALPLVTTGSMRLTSPNNRFAGGFAGDSNANVVAWYGDDAWRSSDGAVTWQRLACNDLKNANSSTRATFVHGNVVLTPGTANGISVVVGIDGRDAPIVPPPDTLIRGGAAMNADGCMTIAVTPKDAARGTISLRKSLDSGATWQETGTLPTDKAVLIPLAGEVTAVYAAGQDFVATCDGGKSTVRAGTTGVVGIIPDAWSSDDARVWVVSQRWTTMGCFDARLQRWRTQPLGALAEWASQVEWYAFAVDPGDSQRIWVVARHGGLAHSSDGGRTWNWFSLPFQASANPSLAFLGGKTPQLLVSVDGGIQVIDASPSASALFSRQLASKP